MTELITGFLKVGCFAFGGAYGAIPLIRDVVLSHGWVSEETLSDMIAVSESTPGPIMVNLATYVGLSQAGLPGAVLATLAVVLPSFFVILLVMGLLKSGLKNPYVQAFLRGVKPCMIGVILATGVRMTLEQLFSESNAFQIPAAAVAAGTILVAILFRRLCGKKLSPILLLVISALLGVVVYG